MNCGRHIKGNRDPVIVLHSDVCKHVGPNAGMATYDAEDCAMGCYGGCYFFLRRKRIGTKGQDTHRADADSWSLESISVFVLWNSDRSSITYLVKHVLPSGNLT